MQNSAISTYWKIVGAVKKSLPPKEDVIKFAFHVGRAANELNKGIKSLRRKKLNKGKASSQPERIKIE